MMLSLECTFIGETMPLNSEEHWSAYKETVGGSQDKTQRKVDSQLHIELSRCAYPFDARSPV
jgi:hypothetical protein